MEIQVWSNAHTLSLTPIRPKPKMPDAANAGPWILRVFPPASWLMVAPTGWFALRSRTDTNGQTNAGAKAMITLKMCRKSSTL